MQIAVQRTTLTPLSTQGELLLDGVHEAWTLEPVWIAEPTDVKPRAIPAGTYQFEKNTSPHFGFVVPVLLNVPGFTAVEIHPGNFPRDTHGCTLVGKIEGPNYVGQSDAEFAALMAKLPDSGEITYADPVS